MELGNKIKFERAKKNLSQEKPAELAGISIHSISDIERGITDIRYINLFQIAEALEITIFDLLDFKPDNCEKILT